MQRLANRVVSPAQMTFGLTLAQVERLDHLRHVASPRGTMECISRSRQQGSHRFGQVHFATSASGRLALYRFSARVLFSRDRLIRDFPDKSRPTRWTASSG